MADIITTIPSDATLLLIMKIVQIVAGIGVLITICLSIWSLWLQKKEVLKQNQKIIELLGEINKKLKS